MDATLPMLKNLNVAVKQLDNIASDVANEYVWACGQLVREKAYDKCPKDTGELAQSIDVIPLADAEVGVGTNKEYAVFVHEGTGIYNKDTSRPGGAYWIYIDHPGSGTAKYKEENPGRSKSYYSLQDAYRAKYFLADKLGIDPDYIHITNGQKPQPFLTQALQEAEPMFDAILTDTIKGAIK